MIRSSVGQANNELAKSIYRVAGRQTDLYIKGGKLPASARSSWFAKTVANGLSKANLPIPKNIAAQASLDASPLVAPAKASLPQNLTNGGAAAVAKAGAAQAAKSTYRAALPVAIVVFVGESAVTGYRYTKGQIDGAEAGKRLAESAASTGGGLGGAVAGAALGSVIFPGPGSVIGAILGGFGGGVGGQKFMKLFTR